MSSRSILSTSASAGYAAFCESKTDIEYESFRKMSPTYQAKRYQEYKERQKELSEDHERRRETERHLESL